MKRKLGIIILAVLLCAVLIFTMVACKKNGGEETPSDPGSATLEGVDNTQIAKVEADLQAYLNTWVETHATETAEDQKNLLRTELNAAKNSYKLKGTDKSSYSPTFNVSFADGKYTVKVSWGEGKLSKTLTVNAKTVTYTNWAGRSSKTSDYEYLEGNNAVSETIDTIVVGLVNSVNKVTANSVTGKFGMDGKLGFDAFGKNYALRVKGNVDTSSKPDNEVGLVIENAAGKEIAGLYYKGADNAKDSRLYIQYLVTENGSETVAYKYIEYADILGFLSGLLTDKEGKSIVKTEAGDGVFASDIDGLTALLTSLDVPQTVRGMIPGIVKLVAKAYQDGDRYLIDINLADVMNKVSDIMSIIGNGEETKLEFLDAIGLDPMNMSGLFGHISISAKVTEVTEGGKKVPYLSDFEFALNIPEDCTFYFSADEDAVKFDLPSIGFAIYLEDFSFVTSDETPIANVIPQEAIRNAAAGKGYFSPTNVDLSGDVYINHKEGEEKASIDSTFHFELVTDINPLEIVENGFDSNARAALVIRQHSGKVAYDAAKKAV